MTQAQVDNPQLLSVKKILGSVILVGAVVMACTEQPSAPGSEALTIREGRSTTTSDMTVASASPDSATQDTTLDVVISGSGFVSGTVADFTLAGVADPVQVRTNSTRYVNSRQLIANITVSASAAVAKWDIQVTASGKKGGIGTEMFAIKMRPNAIVTPVSTFKLPLAGTNVSFRSDGMYSDGVYSVYASGTCNVTGSIFDGSFGGINDGGDATIQTSLSSKGKCGRQFTLTYPDGYTETLASFANLRTLENSSFAIPIGAIVNRRFTINPAGVINKVTPRCSRLFFGEFVTTGVGSDSVSVTRIDATTWHVQSQPAPDDLAYCETNGQLYHMRVDFLIVSSVPLH